MYQQFSDKLDDIGIESATYLNDVPLINLAYGFVRGDFDIKKTLKPFPTDEFDDTKSRIPIYLTQMRTEGLLLELNRKRIIDFLFEKGIVTDKPEEGKEKEFVDSMNERC